MSAALASVGIEAEAGGSAFSKVFTNLNVAVQTNAAILRDYAKVAGMTTKQFAEAFRKDAAGAVISFIEGLGRAGEKAVVILNDMELSEVRMRDALLRAAGAGDLFRESIELGTQAWADNTALTEEAEKAYGSTANQIQIVKNQIDEAAMQIGEALLPTIRDLVENVRDAAQWFCKPHQRAKREYH